MMNITSSRSDDWIYCHFGHNVCLNHNYYRAVADIHNLQFTVAHALGFLVFTRRLLVTEFKESHCD
jgi:hypothetical protein